MFYVLSDSINKMLKIGFLGGGCMANALAKGFMAAGKTYFNIQLKFLKDFKTLIFNSIFIKIVGIIYALINSYRYT